MGRIKEEDGIFSADAGSESLRIEWGSDGVVILSEDCNGNGQPFHMPPEIALRLYRWMGRQTIRIGVVDEFPEFL